MKLRERLAWSLLAVLGLFVAASFAGVVSGGPLDPPGTPGPTGKPIEEVLSSWSRTLAADDGATSCQSSRFTCVFEDQAVLDHETGLVWERYIETVPFPYASAEESCLGDVVGDRAGWRLPTVEELRSVMDPNGAAPPLLPAGHPFQSASDIDPYWTSNTTAADGKARVVWLDGSGGALAKTGDTARFWCVRGGHGHDG